MNKSVLVITDADGLVENSEPAFIIVDIARNIVESGNISSVLERLHILTDSAENVRLYRESMTFIFSGFDNDPRELPEIPEVVTFMRKLCEAWPHWLWFLTRDTGSIALLMALLCKVRVLRSEGGEFATEFEHIVEVEEKLQDLIQRGRTLYSTYRIAQEDIDESISSAVRELT